MGYAFLADSLVALHVAYVGFVVIGQLLILLGLALGWKWVRNPTFRILHLLAIVIVAIEAGFDVECPLTVWERDLRSLAGQPIAEGSFIGRLFHNILFYEGADEALFQKMHIAFGVLVLATFLLAPPRWRRRTGGDSHAPLAMQK